MPKNLSDLKKFIYRHTMFWLMDTKLWYFVVMDVIPFLRLTVYYPKFNKFKYNTLYKLLEPGDILLMIDYRKVTSKLIGGDWSHAGVCVAKGEGITEIIDMTHEGFHETDFFSFVKESERLRIKRVVDPKWTPEYVQHFIANIWSFKGSGYNVSFRSWNENGEIDPRGGKLINKNGDPIHKAHYCSQLPTQADDQDVMQLDWEDLAGLGVPYISPTGLDLGKNLITVADSGNPYDEEVKKK